MMQEKSNQHTQFTQQIHPYHISRKGCFIYIFHIFTKKWIDYNHDSTQQLIMIFFSSISSSKPPILTFSKLTFSKRPQNGHKILIFLDFLLTTPFQEGFLPTFFLLKLLIFSHNYLLGLITTQTLICLLTDPLNIFTLGKRIFFTMFKIPVFSSSSCWC